MILLFNWGALTAKILVVFFMLMGLKTYAKGHSNPVNHIVTDLSLAGDIEKLRNNSSSEELDVRIVGMGEVSGDPEKKLFKIEVQRHDATVPSRSKLITAEPRLVNGKKKWIFSVQEGCGSLDTLIFILGTLESGCRKGGGANIKGIKIGKIIYENLRGWPVDLIASLGYFNHEEPDGDDIEEETISTVVIWKRFPWNKYIRTRFEVDIGVSYVHQIPYVDRRRNFNKQDASHFLGYLEVTIGFNVGDILNFLTQPTIRSTINKYDLSNCYLSVGVINHRSTLFETFDDGYRGSANYVGSSFSCFF